MKEEEEQKHQVHHSPSLQKFDFTLFIILLLLLQQAYRNLGLLAPPTYLAIKSGSC